MIVILKRSSSVLIALIFVIVGLIGGAAVRYIPYSQVVKPTGTGKIKIIVDAGHGSPDGGAVGISGTEEKDINLAIALKLQEILEAKGVNVIMTRKDDNSLYDTDAVTIREKKRSDMNNRLNIMKNSDADLFVSIHMNSFPDSTAKGLHLFYSKSHSDIKELAESIQQRMSDITGAKMHVVKTADSRLFLMKNPPLPSILIECGFISNADEERKLKNEEYQSKLAWAIADALDEYYN